MEYDDVSRVSVPLVTVSELLKACGKLGETKAPDPDGIPNVAPKSAISSRPNLFTDVYDACLNEGMFLRRWKI